MDLDGVGLDGRSTGARVTLNIGSPTRRKGSQETPTPFRMQFVLCRNPYKHKSHNDTAVSLRNIIRTKDAQSRCCERRLVKAQLDILVANKDTAPSGFSISTEILRAELARREEETIRPQCGSGIKGSYNTSAHVFALILILVLSTVGILSYSSWLLQD